MSSNAREYGREISFGVGAFVGMLALAFGLAILVLAMAVGLRRGQNYIAPATRTLLLTVGPALLVVGVLVRLYRERLTSKYRSAVATGGAIAALVGISLILFGGAAETTTSAPFLTTPEEKVTLFALAYVLVAVGLVLLRTAAKIVGW